MSNYSFSFSEADSTIYDMERINSNIKAGLTEMERSVESGLASWDGAVKFEYGEAKKAWNASAEMMTVYLNQARVTLANIMDGYGSNEKWGTKLWNDVRGG